MATRTAKGIVKDKTSGTTLTLSDVSLSYGHCVIVMVGYKGDVAPTVAAGNKSLKRVIQRNDSTAGFGVAIFYTRSIAIANTRDIVATWATATTSKVMAVITLDAPHLFYEGAGNMQNTASPTTSANLMDLPVHDCFHLGCLVSEGPSNDVAPTPSVDWTAGQRDGTVGVPPISNTTLLEGYKTGRCIDAEELDSSGSETRDWCNVLASFKPLVDFPAMDANGCEIEVGDTVDFNGTEYTVSSIIRELGVPFAHLDLGSGIKTQSWNTEIVE